MTGPSFLRPVGRAARIRDGRIALIGVLAVVLLVLQTSIGNSLFRDAGLSRPRATFVELYFLNAQTLPTTVPVSGHVRISFAVDNVATTTRSLVWQVSQAGDNGQFRLASGQAVVGANQTVPIVRNLHVHCSTGRSQLRISIERPSARLTLWLVCPSPR